MSHNYQSEKIPSWQKIRTIVFDFDGIFTNNKVYLSSDGEEIIKCSRGDGLGIVLLKKFIQKKKWDVDFFILSKESNSVVALRAKKLKVPCYQAIDDKLSFLLDYCKKNHFKKDNFQKGLIYLGNDLNDLEAIQFAEYSYVPMDSHKIIKEYSYKVSSHNGGEDFVRNFIEELIQLDKMSPDDIKELLR